MKKYIIFSFSALFCLGIHAQTNSQLKDDKYVQHWKSLPNCCIQDINTHSYQGLIINGEKMSNSDRTMQRIIERIMSIFTDSTTFSYHNFDDTLVAVFENQLFDSLYISATQFYNDIYNNKYYRQYIGIIQHDKKYLLIGFERVTPTACKRQVKTNYKMFKLIYSRVVLADNIDTHPEDVERFWILFDIENKKLHHIKCRFLKQVDL